MQRFGKASVGMRRSATSSSLDLESANRAFDSIANVLDIPRAPSAGSVAAEPALAGWLDLLETSGAPVAIKDLASRVPLSTEDFAEALAMAGRNGDVSFLQDAAGTTFVRREKL